MVGVMPRLYRLDQQACPSPKQKQTIYYMFLLQLLLKLIINEVWLAWANLGTGNQT